MNVVVEMNNYKQQPKLIKRPIRVVPHKRQTFNTKIRQKLAAVSDVPLTPISYNCNMRPRNENQNNSTKETKKTSKKAVKRPARNNSVQSGSGPEVFTTTLNKVKRKKWVPLNAKQKEYISDVMNSAISFATSTLPNSSEEISSLDSFLHAVKIKLMQQLSQIIVPPLKYSAIVGVDKLVNSSNIIQELDDRIETLGEAVIEQKELLAEKKERLASLNLTSKSVRS
ncbi:Hypothetical predicted protein [Octopus vulgaris]|uniref:Centromere protein Q n=1 Tax=Octopus vulgaris TaxID=6645 RepID=A0AA36FPJ4_OCTVU|nr:Hypothetical predicted protein [Octopus vulgaris]